MPLPMPAGRARGRFCCDLNAELSGATLPVALRCFRVISELLGDLAISNLRVT
jgi:hypothetical protein